MQKSYTTAWSHSSVSTRKAHHIQVVRSDSEAAALVAIAERVALGDASTTTRALAPIIRTDLAPEEGITALQ